MINILWVGKKGTFYPDAKIDVFYGEEGYFNLVATNSFATISSEQLKYRWYDANYNLINEGNPFNAFLKEGCNIFYVSLYSESCDVESKKVEYFAYLFNPKNPIIEEFCTENAGFNCKVEKYVMDCVAEPKGCITYTVECSPKLKEETDPLLKKSEHPENSNIEKGFSQNSKSLSFIVVDLLGKKVYEGPVNKFSTNKLHSGIYITYESFNNKTKIVNKIIIQK